MSLCSANEISNMHDVCNTWNVDIQVSDYKYSNILANDRRLCFDRIRILSIFKGIRMNFQSFGCKNSFIYLCISIGHYIISIFVRTKTHQTGNLLFLFCSALFIICFLPYIR